MLPIQISPQDMDQLNKERYTHPHPRVQRKLQALTWSSAGGTARALQPTC